MSAGGLRQHLAGTHQPLTGQHGHPCIELAGQARYWPGEHHLRSTVYANLLLYCRVWTNARSKQRHEHIASTEIREVQRNLWCFVEANVGFSSSP